MFEILLHRHSGEGRNPVIPLCYGCRIKSGMTNWDLFARPLKVTIEIMLQHPLEGKSCRISVSKPIKPLIRHPIET